MAEQQGESLEVVTQRFREVLKKAKFIVGQNVGFDINIMGAELLRQGIANEMEPLPVLDTCTEDTAQLCQIPGGRGGKFKLPTLSELHEFLFDEPFVEAHNATADVEATARCFFELIRQGKFSPAQLNASPAYLKEFARSHPEPFGLVGLEHINFKEASRKIREQITQDERDLSHQELAENIAALEDYPYVHLHNHSQFSVLQSTIRIKDLVQQTAEYGMPAVALTDHANMMGAFHFVKEVKAYNNSVEERNRKAKENGEEARWKPITPIIGCEFHVCEDHSNKNVKDYGYQIVFLAKNKKGYHNLAKMSSLAYTDGFYYVPRIDKNIIARYKDDLIVLTGNLYGEVPSKILNQGEKQAEEALLWWKEQFGDDLYMEIMRHGQEDEDRANTALIALAQKHNVKLVATNNTYYCAKEDANAHDILLCVKDGEKQATPIGRGRGYRYGLPNQEYYFKSPAAMKALFKDLPESIQNLKEVVDKIEAFDLARDVLLPQFEIPDEFKVAEDEQDGGKRGENNYLRHITFEGAKNRYETVTDEIRERIDFELATIENSGYPGYFLIVEDFIREARNMGVSVGPGRGSAAGSVVAYCLGITNIDPLEYDLLFERFLNPDRVSMPDIDIDFD